MLRNLLDHGDWDVVPLLAHRFQTVPVTFGGHPVVYLLNLTASCLWLRLF